MNIGSLFSKPPARGEVGNNRGGDSSTGSAVDAPGRDSGDSGLMSQLGSNPLFTGVSLLQPHPRYHERAAGSLRLTRIKGSRHNPPNRSRTTRPQVNCKPKHTPPQPNAGDIGNTFDG